MADDATLDLVLRKARNHGVWLDKPVTNDQLRQIWDLARTGPTSANCSPARVLFLRSQKAKERMIVRDLLEATPTTTTGLPAPVLVGTVSNREIARLKLAALGVRIDQLTTTQQRYLSSWELGT